MVGFMGEEVYFGTRLLFDCLNMPDFVLGVEISEDLRSVLSLILSLYCRSNCYS